MERNHNTDRNGSTWSEEIKKAVWEKGWILNRLNYQQRLERHEWRYDKCEFSIKYSEHGNRNSEYGWEIDHINPVANGGGDNIENLQPLNWQNNAAKGDSTDWVCPRRQ